MLKAKFADRMSFVNPKKGGDPLWKRKHEPERLSF